MKSCSDHMLKLIYEQVIICNLSTRLLFKAGHSVYFGRSPVNIVAAASGRIVSPQLRPRNPFGFTTGVDPRHPVVIEDVLEAP